MNQKAIDAIMAIEGKYSGLDRDLKSKKVRGAISSYAKGCKESDVVAQKDTTLFGSGKEGFLLTKETLYSSWSEPIPVDKVVAVKVASKNHLELTFQNGKKEDRYLSIYFEFVKDMLQAVIDTRQEVQPEVIEKVQVQVKKEQVKEAEQEEKKVTKEETVVQSQQQKSSQIDIATRDKIFENAQKDYLLKYVCTYLKEEERSRAESLEPDTLLHQFQVVAEYGHKEAAYYCGQICEKKQDEQQAFYWYSQSASYDVKSAYELAKCYEQGKGTGADMKQALYWLGKAAELGDFFAKWEYAERCLYGEGIEKNLEKALYWFESAAEDVETRLVGYYAEIPYQCAVMYENGEGTEKNLEKAQYYYQKGEELEFEEFNCSDWDEFKVLLEAGALKRSAFNYSRGQEQSVEKILEEYDLNDIKYSSDCRKRIRTIGDYFSELEQLGEEGNLKAQIILSDEYDVGKEYEKAYQWAEKAALAGDADSMEMCGVYKEKGYCGKVDYARALDWYMEALAAGIDERKWANINTKCGNMYLYGMGTRINASRAEYFYEQGALAGDPNAQFQLAGILVKGNRSEAFKWYERAARMGHRDAKAVLAMWSLTPEEIFAKGKAIFDTREDFEWWLDGFSLSEEEKNQLDEARLCFEVAAQQGCKEAPYYCGLVRDVARDKTEEQCKKVFFWFLQGKDYDEKCVYRVARCYEDGVGAYRNEEFALELYETALEMGSIDAGWELAQKYEYGIEPIEKDEKKAFHFYKILADRFWLVKAFCQCGKMYEYGIGTEPDEEMALSYYAMAAQKGNKEAQRAVETWDLEPDEIYRKGLLYNNDKDEQMKYWERAEMKGSAVARYAIGCSYLYGTNKSRHNENLAQEKIQQAAEQGYPVEWYKMGMDLVAGTNGARKNYELSKWFVESGASYGDEKCVVHLVDNLVKDKTKCDIKDLAKALYWWDKLEDENGQKLMADYVQSLGSRKVEAIYWLGIDFRNGDYKEKNLVKAAKYLEQAANSGYIRAQFAYAEMCENGEGIPEDRNKAAYWREHAEKQRSGDLKTYYDSEQKSDASMYPELEKALAQCEEIYKKKLDIYKQIEAFDALNLDKNVSFDIAEQYMLGNYVIRDPFRAFSWYERAARAGDLRAYIKRGDMEYKAVGASARDIHMAAYWYKKAVEKGYPVDRDIDYLLKTEEIYDQHKEYEWSGKIEKALECIEKAANMGHSLAQSRCYSFYKGEAWYKKYVAILPPETKEVLLQYEEEAINGVGTAQLFCACRYYYGKGVPVDYEKAMYWYEKAAEQGWQVVQKICADEYYSGAHVGRDVKKALYWYEKSAEQFNGYAQWMCAEMYLKGEGTARDYDKAFYWAQRGAEHDVDKAQFTYAQFYEFGLAGEVDLKKAAYWYEKAAETYGPARTSLRMLKNKLAAEI